MTSKRLFYSINALTTILSGHPLFRKSVSSLSSQHLQGKHGVSMTVDQGTLHSRSHSLCVLCSSCFVSVLRLKS